MALYAITRSNVTMNTSNDLVTIIASSTRPLRVYFADAKGMGTTSTAQEIVLQRSTGGTTGGGAITPEKLDTNAGSAGFTAYTSWSAQPTLSGTPITRLGVNANGGYDKFAAFPGAEIKVPASGQLSMRPSIGSGAVTLNIFVDEE